MVVADSAEGDDSSQKETICDSLFVMKFVFQTNRGHEVSLV